MSYEDDKINKMWWCNLCNKFVGDGYAMVMHFSLNHTRENAQMEMDLALEEQNQNG